MSINHLEEVYTAVKAPDKQERRCLTRVAVKTRLLPVPPSALP